MPLLTANFSTIAGAPCICVPSQLIIELSRCAMKRSARDVGPTVSWSTDIETHQVGTTSIESCVIEVGELLCDRVNIRHCNQSVK